jgi:hypothetical protein
MCGGVVEICGNKKILSFDNIHDTNSSFMRYQILARTNEMLHKLNRNARGLKLYYRISAAIQGTDKTTQSKK